MTGGALHAATLRNASPPAETPPSSYSGKQYVDSRGCIYVRAGFDGAVRWVPRVTRDREHICGARPTQTAASRPQTAKPAPEVAAAPAPKPAARKPAAAKAPAATALAAPAKPAMRKPVRKPVVPAQKAHSARKSMVAQGVCAQLSPLSRRYMGNDPDVRCGPQKADPVSAGRDQGASMRPAANPAPAPRKKVVRNARIVRGTRIAPRHVYENQLQSADLAGPPAGYAPVWTDDRLNRKRAHQTLTGKRSMEARWTRTVPRELKPGRLRAGTMVFHPDSARIVRGPARQPHLSTRSRASEKPAAATAAQPRVSSKSAPASAATAPRPGKAARRQVTHQYVQVAHFSDEGAMRAAAARLKAAGLSVRAGRYTRNGQPHQMLMAGPYKSPERLHAALAAARKAGFSGARVRQ